MWSLFLGVGDGVTNNLLVEIWLEGDGGVSGTLCKGCSECSTDFKAGLSVCEWTKDVAEMPTGSAVTFFAFWYWYRHVWLQNPFLVLFTSTRTGCWAENVSFPHESQRAYSLKLVRQSREQKTLLAGALFSSQVSSIGMVNWLESDTWKHQLQHFPMAAILGPKVRVRWRTILLSTQLAKRWLQAVSFVMLTHLEEKCYPFCRKYCCDDVVNSENFNIFTINWNLLLKICTVEINGCGF